jgi:hypothetical protein
MTKKLAHPDFIRLAIQTLRTERFKGIHSVYSGFNEAFRVYYEGEDPIRVTTELAAQGAIALRPVRHGVMLYLPGEAPVSVNRGEQALRKMGLI